ncbi:hypothetical protein ASG52_05725 [Methylobacterium sp. Leaf456]|nr:hypothetical protein ASG52_05725 [Methylobacterium sp. Leaf456]
MKFPGFVAATIVGLAMTVATVSAASAQATRTWVSGVGDDANPCSRTAPCKTFAGAISKTAAGGVIGALDPGGYGAVTITKAITIRAAGTEGAITATGSNGITINAGTASVALVGLNLDGAGTGLTGVNIIGAAQVLVKDCIISGFSTAGIRISSPNLTRVAINDSTIFNNAVGLAIDAQGAPLNRVLLDNVLVDGNTTNATVNQAASVLIMRRSTMINAPVSLTNGGVLRSFGDNAIGGATPTFNTPLQ